MPGGGTAPISRSRIIPPQFAARKESTSTPKTSNWCLTPAIAPLNAKTKVPQRSSTSTTVLTLKYRETHIRSFLRDVDERKAPGSGRLSFVQLRPARYFDAA